MSRQQDERPAPPPHDEAEKAQPKSTSLVTNPFGQPAVNNPGALAHVEAQKGVAEIQVAMMVAQSRPRNQIAAVDRILNACTRIGLAEAATYSYSKGGTEITGPTIRLAEVLAQNWGNIEFGWRELSRAGGVSEILAYAWDLETNVRHPISFHVKHWRDTKKGGYAIKDEREIYELCANQAGRRLRKCLLDIIPGDVIESALDQCDMTLKTKIDITTDSIKTMLEKFAEFNVTKEQIETRIQRRVDTITPAQFISLRKIYNSLKDAMSIPEDWFDGDFGEKQPEPKAEDKPKPDPAKEPEAKEKKDLEGFKKKQAADVKKHPGGAAVAEENKTLFEGAKEPEAKPAAAEPASLADKIVKAIKDAKSAGEVEAAMEDWREDLGLLEKEDRAFIVSMANQRTIDLSGGG